MFTDGDNLQAVTAASDDPTSAWRSSRETTSALAYRIATPRTVLVPGAGGGMEILRARQLGARARRCDRTESAGRRAAARRSSATTPAAARATRACACTSATRAVSSPRTRSTLRPDPDVAHGRRGGGGLGGLNEDYLHTVEAFRLYLAAPRARGFPLDHALGAGAAAGRLKLVATVVAALEASGVADAAERLLMIRGWQTVDAAREERSPSRRDEVQRLREFCDALSFDVVWFPGIRRRGRQRLQPAARALVLRRRAGAAGTGRATTSSRAYPFDIRPATDDRPYFQNFFRWPVLAEAWRAKDRGGMALLEAGYLLLVSTLVQALLAGLVLILLPLRAVRAARAHQPAPALAGIRVLHGHRARVPVRRDRVPAETRAARAPSDRCAGARARDVPARQPAPAAPGRAAWHRLGVDACSPWRSPASCCSARSTARCSTR